MLAPLRRLPQVRDLIDGKFYFVLHALRQTGKTTLLRSRSATLTAEGRFAALTVSLESFTRDDAAATMPQVLRELADSARAQLPERLAPPDRSGFVGDLDIALRAYLGAWSATIDRPLVIIKVRSVTLNTFDKAEVFELLEQHTEETGQRFEDDAKVELFRQTQGQPWLVNALAAQLVTDFDALLRDRAVCVTREKVLEAREILMGANPKSGRPLPERKDHFSYVP